MATNASNAVCGNFYRRFNKHVKRIYQFNGSQAYRFLKDVLSPDQYGGRDKRVVEWRARIPRKANGYLDEKAHLLMPLTYEFLTDIEERNQLIEDNLEGECNKEELENPEFQKIRVFSLLPYKRGFRSCYFKMCSTGLHALLKRAGVAGIPSLADWHDVADQYWLELFKIEKFETRSRKFADEIQTDEKYVSVMQRKPKRSTASHALCKDDYDVMWGLDPGRRDLFVATSSDGEKKSCSSREFYEDARYTASNKTMNSWKESDAVVERAFAMIPSKKTTVLDNLETYTKFVIPRLDILLGFERQFLSLRFRRYIFAKKKLRELCLQLTARAGARTLVGFGDWSNTDLGGRIKRHPEDPVKTFEAELKRYCRAESIDEFRTSKLHADCHTELNKQFSLQRCRDGRTRTRKAYSVLHCPNNVCFGTTVNRDDNASRNMLLLLQYKLQGLRPIAFCRGT